MGFWQIGRIPNEWARCLLPLVRDKKVRVEGLCKSAPELLALMDTVILSVRYVTYIISVIHIYLLSLICCLDFLSYTFSD